MEQKNKTCAVCGNGHTKRIRTLKHYWDYCPSCHSATRGDIPDFESRLAYRLSRKTLMNHPPPMATSIGKNKKITEDPSLLYDYMASESHVKKHREQYKVYERFISEVMTPYAVSVQGKSILDVSGGNGSFIKEFEALGARVAMSEFNQKSVEFAREKFGINARRYDFNSDDISTLFSDRFDIIMLRYAVMFCNDFNRFMDQLEKISATSSTVIVNGSLAPSMGVFLRSQYDDYTYLVLYSKEKLVEIMQRHGYRLAGSHEEKGPNKADYSHDMHPSVRRCDKWLYMLPARLKGMKIDTAIHSHVMVFQR